jgi:hypothetical protein
MYRQFTGNVCEPCERDAATLSSGIATRTVQASAVAHIRTTGVMKLRRVG